MATIKILRPSVVKCIKALHNLEQPIYKEFIDALYKEEPSIHPPVWQRKYQIK